MNTSDEILTRKMIEELRDEAGDDGDLDMVEICDDALHYEPSHPEWSRAVWMQARRDVAAAISDARAADESKPFVASPSALPLRCQGVGADPTLAMEPIMNDLNFARDLTPLYKPLRAAAMRLTRDPAAAEDLVQDTMVRAWRHRKTFIEGSNVKAWASTILRNTFINGYHRQGRAAQHLADLARSAEQAIDCEPEQAVGSTAIISSIMAAIAGLPSEYRTAVTLADLDGLSYQEIADALECPIGTIMSRIHRGRKALRLALAGEAIEFGLRLAA